MDKESQLLIFGILAIASFTAGILGTLTYLAGTHIGLYTGQWTLPIAAGCLILFLVFGWLFKQAQKLP